MTITNELLEELTNAYGPSGFEGPVRDIMRRELEPLSDYVEVDGIGSLIATAPSLVRTQPSVLPSGSVCSGGSPS